MRILHLVNHCDRGHGNAHVAVDLACVQARNGHSVAYASRGGTYLDLMSSFGVRHEQVVQDRKNPAAALAAVRQLLRFCAAFRPDILHAHMASGALLGYVVSKLTRIPLVNTVHNSFDRKSQLMRLGRCIVAVSAAEQELLLRRGFKADRLHLVVNGPNGSPRESFEPSELPGISRPAVVTVCGLHPRKGIDYLIRAFARVASDQPDWQLYIAGTGPDAESLASRAEALGIAHRVHFLGFVSSPRQLLSACEIFVLASLAEPGALAVSEARAAGCAVIGTSVGGIPEQLEYGRAGVLVDPANVVQLAAALQSLMSDPEQLASAQQRARRNSERFNIDRVVRDYDQVYRHALASSALEANFGPAAK